MLPNTLKVKMAAPSLVEHADHHALTVSQIPTIVELHAQNATPVITSPIPSALSASMITPNSITVMPALMLKHALSALQDITSIAPTHARPAQSKIVPLAPIMFALTVNQVSSSKQEQEPETIISLVYLAPRTVPLAQHQDKFAPHAIQNFISKMVVVLAWLKLTVQPHF
jgi:hypothetical protein